MSTVSAKALSDRKARRQKQILAAGSVILLALVGYQLPKVLDHGSAATPPASSSTAPGGSSSPLAAAPGTLPDTDRAAIKADPGQLVSFGLFKSKDPFVQQLSTSPSAVASAPPSAPASPSAKASLPVRRSAPNVPPAFGQPSAPRETGASPGSGSTVPAPSATSAAPVTSPAPTPVATAPATTTPAAAAPAPTSAAISINGACETVAVHGTFPGQDGVFRLVSIAKDGKSAQIGVAGGSFDSGEPTATLKLGEKVTLVNTTDGTRYVLVLKAKCEVGTQPANNVPATPPTTPASPAPTTVTPPTGTAPIVTDALDAAAPPGS